MQGLPFGQGGQGRQGGGAVARAAAQAAAAAKADRIRVVADTGTNAILLRASPLDMLTIRGLIRRVLDVPDTDSEAVQRTWILGPLKNTTAAEVAQVLEGAYREAMGSTSQSQVGGFPGFSFFGFQGQQQQGRGAGQADTSKSGKATTAKLSLGVNDRTNTLVAVCSTAMYKDVKEPGRLPRQGRRRIAPADRGQGHARG